MRPLRIRVNPDLPPELERIINKALEKDRDLRFQTAAELRADLKRMKRDSESGRISSAQSPLPSPKPKRRWMYVVAALLMLAVIGAAVYFFLQPSWFQPAAISSADWIQLTDFPDSATQPALSPDGHMLVFIRGPETFITDGQIYLSFCRTVSLFSLRMMTVRKLARYSRRTDRASPIQVWRTLIGTHTRFL